MEIDKTVASTLLFTAALFRGMFINQVSYIEKLIDVRIANHFCDTEAKSLEIVDLVLGDRFISFESKRTIFEQIRKIHSLKLYSEETANFSRLTSIQNLRNKLAHLIIASDDNSLEKFKKDGTIGFVKFNAKARVLYYTQQERTNFLADLDKTITWLKI